MIKRVLNGLYILLAALIGSCASDIEADHLSPTSSFPEPVDSDFIVKEPAVADPYPEFDYSNTSLADYFTDTVYAAFSAIDEKDRFTIFVPAGLIAETQTEIRIVNESGDLVYEHVFTTSDLASGYTLEQIKTDEEMKSYILERAGDVLGNGVTNSNELEKGHFLLDAEPGDFEDYETFEHARENDLAVFCYMLHEEEHYFLCYSEKEKKVVHVIYCC